MGLAAQEELELRLLRRGFAARRRRLGPVLAVQVALLSLRHASMEPLRPLILYLALHTVVFLAFEYWAETASCQRTKARLRLREHANALACAVGCCLCSAGAPGAAGQPPLLRFAQLVLAPLLAVYLSDDFCLPTKLFLVAHLLLAGLARLPAAAAELASGGPAGPEGGVGEAWQEPLGLLAFHALLFKVGAAQAGTERSQEMVGSLFGTLSFLLSITCDGFFVLDEKDTVIAASQAAEVFLECSGIKPEHGLPGQHFGSLFEEGEGSQQPSATNPRFGLSSTWLRSGRDNSRVKLELYTVPCRLSAAGLAQLLELGPEAAAARGEAAPREAFLCAARVVETKKEATEIRVEPAAGDCRAASAASSDLGGGGGGGAGGPPLQAQALAQQLQGFSSGSEAHRGSAGSSLGLGGGTPTSRALAPLFFRSPWRFEALAQGPSSLLGSYRKIEHVPGHISSGAGNGTMLAAQTAQGDRVAIKEISLAGMQCQRDFPLHLRAISREADTLKKIAWASPVVIRMTDCWLQNDFSKACLVTEWLPNSLEGVLNKFRSEKLISVQKQVARMWFAHMVAGVASIHAAGFVHCDIKPSNIWLTEDLKRCKVAGLGISRPLKRKSVYGRASTRSSLGALDDNDDMQSDVGCRSNISGFSDGDSCLSGFTALNGSNAYSSPEMLADRRHTEQTDIFSLGCILLEMLTLAPLGEMALGAQEETSPEEAAWSLVADARVRCFEVECIDLQSLSVNCAELPGLSVGMLSLDPCLRPVASDIVSRSKRLQTHLAELIEESPKLRGVLIKQSRRVHFDPNKLQGDLEELPGDSEAGGSDSGSELAPAVA